MESDKHLYAADRWPEKHGLANEDWLQIDCQDFIKIHDMPLNRVAPHSAVDPPTMPSALQLLAQIISTNVNTIEAEYDRAGLKSPSLKDSYVPSAIDSDAAVVNATRLIIAAAAQLIATVAPPPSHIEHFSAGLHQTISLGLVDEYNLADVLHEAGPQGLHAKEIGERAGIDGATAGRILRYLATRHIFSEVKPDTYANNRISSELVKKKSVKEIQTDLLTKYDGAPRAAYAGFLGNEVLKSGAYMPDFIRDPKGCSAPFNMAMADSKDLFSWFQTPENKWRGARFSSMMNGISELHFPPDFHLAAFDWKSLKEGSVVADVGGNVGTMTLGLAKELPHLNFVVMDLEHAIKEAGPYWMKNYPEALEKDRVKLQVHDFLTPMPLRAAVYVLRVVIHDWPEADCIKILKHIRDAAAPDSKLILFELIMPLACEEQIEVLDADDQVVAKAPEPLLPNFGVVDGGFPTFIDLGMLALFNGRERTIQEYVALGDAAGWKLDYVKQKSLGAFVYSPK